MLIVTSYSQSQTQTQSQYTVIKVEPGQTIIIDNGEQFNSMIEMLNANPAGGRVYVKSFHPGGTTGAAHRGDSEPPARLAVAARWRPGVAKSGRPPVRW